MPVERGRARESRRVGGRPRSCGKQADAGVDVVNDGEMSKPSYATYIKDRLSGFGGTGNTFVYQDLAGFPRLEKRVFGDPGRSRRKTPACNAAIGVRDPQAARTDVAHLQGRACRASRCRTHFSPPRRRASCRSSSATSIIRATRRTSPRSPKRCATSTRRSPARASCCRSTVPTSAWGGTSSTPT